MERDQEHLVTVCAVLRNDQDLVESFVTQLSELLDARFAFYEILLVDNRSTDRTPELVEGLQAHTPNLRLLRLSRVFSIETAVTAALDNSIGDYVAMLEPRYDDLNLIPALVTRALEGNDIVVVRQAATRRYHALDRWMAGLVFTVASQILGQPMRVDETRCRIYSRRAVNALAQIRRKRRYLKYSNALIGYSQAFIQAPAPSESAARKPVQRLETLSLVVDLVVSNSGAPLRGASFIGLLASTLSLFYIMYIFVVTLLSDDIVEGWLTTNLVMTSMFFMLFLILTILSEYVARILDETKDEPLYFIESESNSTVATYTRVKENAESLNVVDSGTQEGML